jgi:Secretion system C-terminal sorting domain
MKKLSMILLLVCGVFLSLTQAQTRYLQPVFSGVTANAGQTYGFNATVLYYSVFNQAVPQPLKMDVYTPFGDTETKRPVVLVLHTGNFLPFYNPSNPTQGGFNGSCGGTIKDSSIVEICTRLAKMGYVAAAVDYRLGWNPLAPNDVQRRYGIINAAYRGIQDTRTCIRYFKKSVAEANNPWGVDTTKITVFGQGTGGYIALGAATLDKYLKIPTAPGGKFIYDHDGNAATPPIPMVIEQINGNIDGTSVGAAPSTVSVPFDTLCYPNHVGYTSKFQLMVNMGGALADSSWVDPGQPAMISYHVPTDNYAPYGEGVVNVPGTNLQVVTVQGAYVVQHLADSYGNNNSFADQTIYTSGQAEAFAESPVGYKDYTPGLYPFNIALDTTGVPVTTAPWEWTSFVPATGTCNNNSAEGRHYMDTVFNFFAPRACFALGLQGCVDKLLSEKEPIAPASINVATAPNPAADQVVFTSNENNQIIRVALYDRNGRIVRTENAINNNSFTLTRNGLVSGSYFAKVSFKEGFVTKQIIFE